MARDNFVRNEQSKLNCEPYPIRAAFSHALEGVRDAVRSERNLKIDLCVAVFVVILGVLFALPLDCWLAIVVCIGMVLSLETMNTALETLVDLASPDFHLLAKKAKDCAAGAVLIAAVTSVAVGFIIFLPRICLSI